VRMEVELGPTIQKMEQVRKRAIRLGDKVRLRALGTQGVITALTEEEAELQVGVLRVRARVSDLEFAVPEEQSKTSEQRPQLSSQEAKTSSKRELFHASPGMELDLRGKRADEAEEELSRYLDAAFLAGLLFVRIIHGKGTGKLREVVRQAVQRNPQVRSFEAGNEKEGGEGVTVVKLAVS